MDFRTRQLTVFLCVKGSLHNLPDYVSSRNDLNRSISGSGVIKRYGSLRQSNNVSQSQVSYRE